MASFRSVRGQPRFLAATAIFAGLSAGVIGFALVGMRTDAIAIATVRASDTATILADDLANLAASYDVTLRDAAEIVNNVAQGRTITSDDAAIIERALASRRLTMNRSEMIAVADQNGEVVAAANDQGRPVVNVSDREYFERLRDDRAAGLYMSRPLRSKTTGAWVIVLARRIETASGRFLGVAFAGVDVGKLMRPGPEITQNGGADVSLFYFDGTIATLEPPRPDLIGTLASTSPQWRKVAAEGGGLYHSWGLVDPRPKYVAVRQVGDYPFFVNVAVTDEAALATWRTRALTVVVGGIMGIALVLALLYSQMRLTDRLSRSRLRSWMRGRRLAANAAELLDIRKRFGLTLDYISQGMAMFDASEKLVFANRCYAELYGLEAEELRPGMDVREIFALRIAKGAYARGAPQEYLKVLDEPYAATRLDFLQNGRVILVREKETDEGGWVTVQEDATQRTNVARELTHTALHDSLTQLPNRGAFKDYLAERVDSESREPLAVLLVDIDGFKEVNDTYGHEIGDDVLIEVGRRIAREANDCYIARLGGDEFAAVASCPRLDPDVAGRIAERVIAAIQQPIEVAGRVISLALCVGVNVLGAEDRDFSGIMRGADLALDAAKKQGRNGWRRFDREMARRYSDRVQLAHDLQRAVERRELTVHYQPIVEAGGLSIVCMEALARWTHPIQGPISPATFVPIAEETGQIVALGNCVLRQACADAANWRSNVVVAVNVSSLQVERPDFAETVITVIEETGLAPQRLQLEITESILLRNNEATHRALHRLRAFGVTLALDDFGTGFASLSYLKAFPLDKVKIDKSFVDDICLNKHSIAIVAAIVALARGLDVETTAEGVETQDQYDILRAIGVATMQGYLFGRPKAIAEYEPSLSRSEAGAAEPGNRAA